MNINIIKKILRLWDPYNLVLFPADEYDSYAQKIFTYYNSNNLISVNQLTNYVFEILKHGLMSTDGKQEYNLDLYFNIYECERFAELFFEILKNN